MKMRLDIFGGNGTEGSRAMRDKLNDVVAFILLVVGLILAIGGVLLGMVGHATRWMVGAGALMVFGVLLYCQFREVDDGH